MIKAHPKRPFLKEWRKLFRLSQETIAERIGIDYSTYGRWENGKLGVDDATFTRIAAAYGITVAELSAHPDDRERAKEMGRILEIMRDLDAPGLAALATIAERLKPSK